ncbi:hypothetical protein AB6A40_003587 [Gnathostoma spinigerum]|uniref:rRNA processing protein EBP2 n=1 Tax=Gnathostoma spinigerum TaxID=75299 RepID=A0ABD6EA59_9BILA
MARSGKVVKKPKISTRKKNSSVKPVGVAIVSESGDVSELANQKQAQMLKEVSVRNAEEVETESDGDSDKELQIAFQEGLLKPDALNYVVEKKRPFINKTVEMNEKLKKLEKNFPWIEKIDVTVPRDEITMDSLEDEFGREVIFYKQAEKAVRIAFPQLLQIGVKVFRPSDYYAEMAKSDEHMQKVRKKMLEVEHGKKRQDALKKIREEKKFAVKVQKEVLENRQAEKKKFLEAVKKRRKGMKEQLDEMLDSARRLQTSDDDDETGLSNRKLKTERHKGRSGMKKMSRKLRDRKYGFGGQKKRSKMNTLESVNDIPAFVLQGKKRRTKGGFGSGFKRKGGFKIKGKKR